MYISFCKMHSKWDEKINTRTQSFFFFYVQESLQKSELRQDLTGQKFEELYERA